MRFNLLSRYAAALVMLSLAAGHAGEEKTEGISAEIDIPVAVGQVLKGMRLPQYDKNKPDKLTMRINADAAERTNDTQFTFKGLRIEIFEDSPDKPSLQVILNDAVFDRETGRLTSIDQARITGEQFTITGNKLEFDYKTRNSRLLGPVFMTITQVEKNTTP